MSKCDDSHLTSLAQGVAHVLRARGLKIVAAESCTGGWLAKVLTDIAGSSEWFERGFVTYSNEAKIEQLDVDPRTLRTQGAVSEQTAGEMAAGALRHSRAQISVAVTGIAGPGGGAPDKPVGTVWIAWQLHDGSASSARHLFAGDRERIRYQSVVAALQGILKLVQR